MKTIAMLSFLVASATAGSLAARVTDGPSPSRARSMPAMHRAHPLFADGASVGEALDGALAASQGELHAVRIVVDGGAAPNVP